MRRHGAPENGNGATSNSRGAGKIRTSKAPCNTWFFEIPCSKTCHNYQVPKSFPMFYFLLEILSFGYLLHQVWFRPTIGGLPGIPLGGWRISILSRRYVIINSVLSTKREAKHQPSLEDVEDVAAPLATSARNTLHLDHSPGCSRVYPFSFPPNLTRSPASLQMFASHRRTARCYQQGYYCFT